MKKVHIANSPPNVKIYERSDSDVFDVEIIQDVLLHFLNSTVREAFQNTNLRESPTNPDIRDYISITLPTISHPHPISDKSLHAVMTYLFENMNQPVASVFNRAIKLRDPVAHFSALILMHAGLLNVYFTIHCKNKCHHEKRPSAVKAACRQMHQAIKTAIGIDEIRPFDRLLRIASNNRCTITQT